jgi:hypothetical protein
MPKRLAQAYNEESEGDMGIGKKTAGIAIAAVIASFALSIPSAAAVPDTFSASANVENATGIAQTLSTIEHSPPDTRQNAVSSQAMQQDIELQDNDINGANVNGTDVNGEQAGVQHMENSAAREQDSSQQQPVDQSTSQIGESAIVTDIDQTEETVVDLNSESADMQSPDTQSAGENGTEESQSEKLTAQSGEAVALAASMPIMCTAGTVYSVSSGGQLRQITNGIVTAVGTAASNVSSFNGVGIGSGGGSVYAYERTNNDQTMTLYQYNVTTGAWAKVPNLSAYNTTLSNNGNYSGSLVAGAVDLSTGNYFFGGFQTTSSASGPGTRYSQVFKIWQYTPSSNSIVYKGYVTTISNSSSQPGATNGDMAFDANGNIFIVRGSGSTTTVFSVTAANLAAAVGGAITSSGSNSFTTTSDVNGIAFDASGKAYLGAGSTIESFNMPDWSNKTTVTNGLSSSTDLASCSSPATVTLEKVVNGRVNSTDQFTLVLKDGPTELGKATTEGTANGVQSERVGPQPTVRNKTLTFSESAAGTTNINQYVSTWQCVVDGTTQLASGEGMSGSVTIPTTGSAVLCRFTNSPLVAHVNVTKTVLDAGGGNSQPGVGWTVGSNTSATQGTASQSPAGSQQTGTDGKASWSLTYDKPDSLASVHVNETQQTGYAFVSGQCVVKDNNGAAVGNAISIPSESGVDITGVKPGYTVDCSFTNRLQKASLTIIKTIDATFGGSAKPDDFKLTATPEGKTAIAFTSNETQDVDPGTYAIGETLLPGYEQDGVVACAADGKPLALTDAKVSIANGQNVICTIANKTLPGTVTWLKTDESGHALGDSQWTLTGPDVPTNTTIADCTSAVCPTGTYADQDPRPGYFELLGQHWGDYILVEYKAPAGYERDTTEHPYTINSERWKNDLNGVTNAGTFVNKQKTPPTLPFTGGVSTDAFVIGGSVMMLLALGTGVVIRRRKVDSTY